MNNHALQYQQQVAMQHSSTSSAAPVTQITNENDCARIAGSTSLVTKPQQTASTIVKANPWAQMCIQAQQQQQQQNQVLMKPQPTHQLQQDGDTKMGTDTPLHMQQQTQQSQQLLQQQQQRTISDSSTSTLPASSSSTPPLPSLTINRLICSSVPLLQYNELIYTNLLNAETRYLPNPTYIETVQSDLSYLMRSILIDWLCEVSQEYKLSTQSLYLSINYLDRYLSIVPIYRTRLQLLGITTLLIAAKYYETRIPTIDDFIYISDSTYSREEVLDMEVEVLNTLKYSLCCVTPYDIVTRIGDSLGGRDPESGAPTTQASESQSSSSSRSSTNNGVIGMDDDENMMMSDNSIIMTQSLSEEQDVNGIAPIMNARTQYLAEMMMELFLLEPHYMHYRPSVIAVSSIFLSLYTLHQNPWPVELEAISRLSVESIQLCVRAMHASYLNMGGTNQEKKMEQQQQQQTAAAAQVQPPTSPTSASSPPPVASSSSSPTVTPATPAPAPAPAQPILKSIKEKYSQRRYLSVATIPPRLM